jgi:hypothetical protein
MKSNKKIVFLIESGLSIKTVSKMTPGQINILVEKFKRNRKETKENWTEKSTVSKTLTAPANSKDLPIPTPPPGKTNKITVSGGTIQLTQNEGEMTEDDVDNVTTSNSLGKDSLQSYTGQESPHDANDMADDGMDDDSGNNRSMMGMAEGKINEKFESKAQQGLFWARCNKCSDKKCKWCKMAKEFSDSTSKKQYKDMPEKKHPEKNVKYKKKKTNENVQRYLENKILEMLEEEKKRKQYKKKESENMILKNPKKVTMFSKEAPMKLPIGRMFSIGKK